MKIIQINQSEIKSPGGVHKTIRELSKNLSKNGHGVIALQSNPNNLSKEEMYKGFKIVRVDSSISKYLYGFSPEMNSFLKKNLTKINPDIIHIHGYHTLFSISAIYAIKKIDPSIPIVFSPHYGIHSHSSIAGIILWKPYNWYFGRKIFNLVNMVLSASDFEKNSLLNDFNIGYDKILIIPHGVNFFNSNKPKYKRNDIRLIYGGYLLKLKGVQHIIYSIKELIDTFKIKNVVLQIFGDGPYKKKLMSLIEELNVQDYVIFNDLLDHEDFLNQVKNSDVFLLLSEGENFGIVVAESLALGTPVIVSNRTALMEFTKEPGCYSVDYPPDPKKVAELILQITSNEVKVGPFSEKIRTWEEVTDKYENIYSNLLK